MKIRTTIAKYAGLFALAFTIGLCFAPQGQADLCAPDACFIIYPESCPGDSPCPGDDCRKWFTERIPNGACCTSEMYFDYYQCL